MSRGGEKGYNWLYLVQGMHTRLPSFHLFCAWALRALHNGVKMGLKSHTHLDVGIYIELWANQKREKTTYT